MPRTTWVWSCAGWCARTASRPPRRGAAARSSFSCCTGRGSPRPPSAPQARPRSGAAPRGHSTRNSGQTEISLASRLAGVAQAARARLERMRTIRAHRRSPRVLRRRGRGDATHADRQHHRARGRPRTEAGAFDARPSPIRVHPRAAAIDRGDHVSGNRARRRPCRARSTPCTASRARRLRRTPTIAHGVASPPPRRSPSPRANRILEAPPSRLVNLLNLAPDAVDAFLLPLGVRRVRPGAADPPYNVRSIRARRRSSSSTPTRGPSETSCRCTTPRRRPRQVSSRWHAGTPSAGPSRRDGTSRIRSCVRLSVATAAPSTSGGSAPLSCLFRISSGRAPRPRCALHDVGLTAAGDSPRAQALRARRPASRRRDPRAPAAPVGSRQDVAVRGSTTAAEPGARPRGPRPAKSPAIHRHPCPVSSQALANHTALLASGGARVDPPRVVACDRSQIWVNPYFVRDDCKSTPPASGHPRNETLPRILGALVDPRTAEDRLVCQVCDTKYGRRDSEK